MNAKASSAESPEIGSLTPTDDIIWRSGDAQGDNNNNNGKGGTYYGNIMAVMTVTKTGMTYKLPKTKWFGNSGF